MMIHNLLPARWSFRGRAAGFVGPPGRDLGLYRRHHVVDPGGPGGHHPADGVRAFDHGVGRGDRRLFPPLNNAQNGMGSV